jgi:hypothetical protein
MIAASWEIGDTAAVSDDGGRKVVTRNLQPLAGGTLSASRRVELHQGKQELVEGLTTFRTF